MCYLKAKWSFSLFSIPKMVKMYFIVYNSWADSFSDSIMVLVNKIVYGSEYKQNAFFAMFMKYDICT